MAELAVVVMSTGAPRMLVEAVRSVLAQSMSSEIVVVNSGGGDAAGRLRAAGLDVPVIEFAGRLMPGATRNRGIEATSAPYVAFLAMDCLACEGWTAARLQAHRAGAMLVASSLLPDRLRSPVAWGSHLALHARRLPGTPAEEAALYGVSYARELFDRFGLFDEDVRISEDTEFNARVAEAGAPLWAPEVCTIHRAPTNILSFLHEQHARGRRTGEHFRNQGRKLKPKELRRIQKQRTDLSLGMARIAVPAPHRPAAALATPLIRLAHAVYVRGLATGNRA